MPLTRLRLETGPDDVGRRLDRILRALLPSAPLSLVQKLLRDGDARLSGRKAEGSARVAPGDWLDLALSEALAAEAVRRSVAREPAGPAGGGGGALPGLILAESADLIIVNKPRGMLTHGEGGLDLLVSGYLADRAALSLAFVPAPLHRLDRNTSGAVVVSASLRGARAFSEALREGSMMKFYLALVEGDLRGAETWEDALSRDGDRRVSSVSEGGRAASLEVRPLAGDGRLTLAGVILGSGLTHQIRAQAAAHGHPLAGDRKYGGGPVRGSPLPGGSYLLHCARLGFPEELLGMAPRLVDAPLPAPAERRLSELLGPGCLSRENWPGA